MSPELPPLRCLGGRSRGAEGPSAAVWGRSWSLEHGGRGGCRVVPQWGAPRSSRRDALPARLRPGDARAARPGRAGSWSISLCRGEAIYQDCACVLVRHLEISFVRIVASLCWHRCLFRLHHSSFPTLVQNSDTYRGIMLKPV